MSDPVTVFKKKLRKSDVCLKQSRLYLNQRDAEEFEKIVEFSEDDLKNLKKGVEYSFKAFDDLIPNQFWGLDYTKKGGFDVIQNEWRKYVKKKGLNAGSILYFRWDRLQLRANLVIEAPQMPSPIAIGFLPSAIQGVGLGPPVLCDGDQTIYTSGSDTADELTELKFNSSVKIPTFNDCKILLVSESILQISETEITFLRSLVESGSCVVLLSTREFGRLALISLLRHFVDSPYPVTAFGLTSMPDFGRISVLTGATVLPRSLDQPDHCGSATSVTFTRDRTLITQSI